jgi:ABC-2 type transport system ATP-binding protein
LTADSAIRTLDLSKSFGDRHAVRGVSFEVAPGEIFGYLGRNGSGKTTTVRMLTTLTRPTSGGAWVAGVDVAREPAAVRRRIGVTMQEAALDPAMIATEHLVLAGRLLGLSKSSAAARADELLELFGLSGDGSRRIATYSGGMQRRLDIATSLIGEPEILFLDEPTNGLDPQSRRALWAEIRRLRANGVTIFLTTQYLEEADQLADRLAIIDEGTIIAEGSPAELKRRHGKREITVRVDNPPTLERALGEYPVRQLNGHVVIDVETGVDLDPVLDAIRGAVGTLDGLSIADVDLEDVFVRLTGLDIAIASSLAQEDVA